MFIINRYEYRNATYKGSITIDERYIRDLNELLEHDYELSEDFKPLTMEDIHSLADHKNSDFTRRDEKVRRNGREYYLEDELWDIINDDLWSVNFECIDYTSDDWEDEVEEEIECR